MPTLQFKGKNIIWNHHLSVPYHTLEEVSKLHFHPEKANGNLIIEGDNLLALKALLPMFAGKVKVVCIDPPYNTGNEGWVYNDNANSPLVKDWLGKEVGKDDLTRHDKWLCMMTPRLKLLRELLADDGVIFVCIDDNETHHLRTTMDEIFGEENFIGQTVRVSSPTQNVTQFMSIMHDYALVYCKSKEKNEGDWEVYKNNYEEFETRAKKLFEMDLNAQEIEKELKELVKYPRFYDFDHFYNCDENGVYQTVSAGGVKKGNTKTQILHPITKKPCKIPQDGWRYKEEEIRRMEKENEWHFGEDENTIPRKKLYLRDYLTQNPRGINFFDTQRDIRLLREIGVPFDFPKPIEYIKHLIRMVTKGEYIVFDSFSGSGTTGHAVMDLNKEDGGNRKFILVQMTEATEKDPNKNICKDITRERIKRAIEKYGYDSGFKYLRVGQPLDAETLLEGKLPDYRLFAKYVYYLCTGENLKEEKKINEKKFFIGVFGKQAIYLIYEQDYEALTRMALNLELAEKIIADQPDKKRIVYAPACFLDEEYMEANQIEFVSIPYNLFQRKTS